jgi:hypothetical protein
MKRNMAMLTSAAVAALVAGAAARPSAASEPIPQAHSYADLLVPVPNAMERLAASDAAAGTIGEARVVPAQYYYYRRPVHRYRRIYRTRHIYRRHYYGGWAPPVYYYARPYYYGSPYYHHHHHHHHHHD